jgi:glycosyltransferase involved in cell wall biosynthesis
MIVIHVTEAFGGGVKTAIESIKAATPEIEHRLFLNVRIDGISTDFTPWIFAQRSINPLFDFLALCTLVKYLYQVKRSTNGTIIVHLHSSKAGILGRLACLLLNIKKVGYTPHAAPFLMEGNRLKIKMYRWLEHFFAKLSGKVIACGYDEQQMYQTLGIDALVIPNGVRVPEIFDPAKNKNTVVSLGRYTAQKNPEGFEEVAKMAQEAAIPFSFHWIGGKPNHKNPEKDNLRYTDWQPASDTQSALEESILYLSLSKWEGLPYSVLEAMAIGLPVILSDIPGHRELMDSENSNGYLVKNPTEAFQALIAFSPLSSEEKLQMGANSRKLIKERYSLENLGLKARAVYQAL